jgi:hypothetical protein
VIFAVPHATLVVFHPYKPSTIRRLKARGLPIPYRGLQSYNNKVPKRT